MSIEISDIITAIHGSKLYVTYQPVVDCNLSRIVSVEATPKIDGYLFSDVLATIEKYDYELLLFRHTCRTIVKDYQLLKKYNIKISINITHKELNHSEILNVITKELIDKQVDPTTIIFELQGNPGLIKNNHSKYTVSFLYSFGFNIAIDQFGTDHMCFDFFKSLPIYELKISETFTTNLIENNFDQAFMKSMVYFCNRINVRVLATGVTSSRVLSLLPSIGVRYVQGSVISSPVPIDQLIPLLDRQEK